MPRSYAWFLGGVASWALAAGMHQVLFSWLVVGELRGSAQPSLLFLLLGGVIADRSNRRRLLFWLHAAAALAALAMSGVVDVRLHPPGARSTLSRSATRG